MAAKFVPETVQRAGAPRRSVQLKHRLPLTFFDQINLVAPSPGKFSPARTGLGTTLGGKEGLNLTLVRGGHDSNSSLATECHELQRLHTGESACWLPGSNRMRRTPSGKAESDSNSGRSSIKQFTPSERIRPTLALFDCSRWTGTLANPTARSQWRAEEWRS